MAESTANPINTDLFSSLQGPDTDVQNAAPLNTDPLEAAVRKCLHPPSAIPSFGGLPTNDVRSEVIAEYVDVGINKTPMIYDNVLGATRLVTAPDLQTFDYAMLTMNGARVSNVPFVFNATQNVVNQDLNNVGINDVYNFEHFSEDATLYRVAAKSSTTTLNATAFNDTGMATGGQFNPNILFAGTILAMAAQCPLHFYNFIAQILRTPIESGKGRISKRHPNYSKHLDAFSQFPAYVQTEIRRKLGFSDEDVPHLDPNTSIQVVSFGVMPTASVVPTPAAIMNQSTRSYTGKALDGTFITHRQNTISPAWCTAGNTGASNHGLYECYYHYEFPAGIPHFTAFLDNQAVGTAPGELITLQDTLWSKDQTWGWVYYQGLSMNSQTNTTFQLIMRKIYTILEIQPAFTSPWAGMSRQAPQPNARAMQAIMDGFYGRKDCMPACYNFWGALLGAVAPSLLKVGESLIKHLTKSEDTGRTDNSIAPKPPQQLSQRARGPARPAPLPSRLPATERPSRIPVPVGGFSARPSFAVRERRQYRRPPMPMQQQFSQMQLVPAYAPRPQRQRPSGIPRAIAMPSQLPPPPTRRNRRRLPSTAPLYTDPIVRGN